MKTLDFKRYADWPLDHAHLPCITDGYIATNFQLVEAFMDFACLRTTTDTAARQLLISFAKDKLKAWKKKWDSEVFGRSLLPLV